MSEKIEVPRELIEAGDIDAIKKLIEPNESLFGRWATHKKYGRVLCTSDYPWQNMIHVVYKRPTASDGVSSNNVNVADLTFEPLILTTIEDFENAPVGTIVDREDKYPLEKHYHWHTDGDRLSDNEMAKLGQWKIVRWGK